MSKQKEKIDGIQLHIGEIIINLSFDQFRCVLVRLEENVKQKRNLNELRQDILDGELDTDTKLAKHFLEAFDYCTNPSYERLERQKRIAKVLQKEK